MKFKTSASLMIAVVLGLVTAYVGIDMLKKAKGGAGPALKVVVAARDMEPGYVIEETDLKLEPVSATFAPAKSIKETKLVVGRTVMATVVKGYPILDNQLSAPGAGSGMQAMIPRGMRAFAVEASEGSAAAGLITPGSFVDVIATLRKGDEPISMAVVQKAKVQFVQRSRATRSSSSSAAAGSPDALGPIKTVTLLVTPKQANALELAQNSGKLKLVLRGNADDSDAEDSAITQREMLGLPPEEPKPETVVVEAPPTNDAFAEPVEPPVDNRRPVQMIKGGSESTIYFDKEGNQSSEEGNGSAPGSEQAQKSSQKKRPATRPQPEQPQTEDGSDPRTASGASPDSQAPRTEAGRGTLRRGM